MAGNTAFILVCGLAGSLAVPSDQPPGESPLTNVSSLPLKINNTLIPHPQLIARSPAPEAGEELLEGCDSLCKVCNLTSKVINGSCKCLHSNGSEVVCTVGLRENLGGQAWARDEIGDNRELDIKPEGEDDGVMRGERCLLTMARPPGVLQNMLGQGLKGMTTEERLAEFRKRVESLRRKPSIESDKTKECDRDTESTPDKDSTPLYVLPVSPFMNKNVGEKFPKDTKESVQIEEDNVPLINSNLGEYQEKSENEKEAVKIEKDNVEVVEEIKPSFAQPGDIVGMAKPSSCLAITPFPGRPAVGSSELTESSGGSGIKLPTQFLTLTKIRERMVDLDKIPDDNGELPIVNGKQVFPFLKPLASISSMVKPPAPLKPPNATPMPTILSPIKISSRDEILQSSPTKSSLTIPVLPDQKKCYVSVLETGEKSSQFEKQGPILEGIIAIPKYVRINKQFYNE